MPETMIKELVELEAPPTTLGDFMPPHKIINKVDNLLYSRLEACLPDITPYLTDQPSRESGLIPVWKLQAEQTKFRWKPRRRQWKVAPAWKSQEGQARKADWNPRERQSA